MASRKSKGTSGSAFKLANAKAPKVASRGQHSAKGAASSIGNKANMKSLVPPGANTNAGAGPVAAPGQGSMGMSNYGPGQSPSGNYPEGQVKSMASPLAKKGGKTLNKKDPGTYAPSKPHGVYSPSKMKKGGTVTKNGKFGGGKLAGGKGITGGIFGRKGGSSC